ncbi:hypothetical protein Golob_002405 [Gossypium lobatum]|uniref:Uncharacterized protein n=1 Tax=Gossypium lobatum TaxID=34289 RepID=A0A7J8N4Z8_9ROSI|nr:hypothetical protein [Gossypium lobatum]
MAVPQMVYGVPMISFAGDGFYLPYPLDLIVNRKQHGLSNINYQVSDGKGNLYLLADGSYTTLFRKRVLRNSAGFPILTIREKGKKESFRVSVHSGVDYAFIAALIIILVECE